MREHANVRQVCSNCKTRKTPLWRKGPNNTYNCNACGLYYRVYKRDRPLHCRSSPCSHRAGERKGYALSSTEGGVLARHFGGLPGHRGPGSLWEEPGKAHGCLPCLERGLLLDEDSDTASAKNKNRSEKKHCMPRTNEMEKTESNERPAENNDDVRDADIFSTTYLHTRSLKDKHPHSAGSYLESGLYSTYRGAGQKPLPFSSYPPEYHAKAPKECTSSYLGTSGTMKLLRAKTAPSKAEAARSKGVCVLNKEEMEAAEALAGFARYARHRG